MNDALYTALPGRSAAAGPRGASSVSAQTVAAPEPAAVNRFQRLWASAGAGEDNAAETSLRPCTPPEPQGVRRGVSAETARRLSPEHTDVAAGLDAADESACREAAGEVSNEGVSGDVSDEVPGETSSEVSSNVPGDLPDMSAADAGQPKFRPSRHADGDQAGIDGTADAGGAGGTSGSSTVRGSVGEDDAADGLDDASPTQSCAALLIDPSLLPIALTVPPPHQPDDQSSSQMVFAGTDAPALHTPAGYPSWQPPAASAAYPRPPADGQAPSAAGTPQRLFASHAAIAEAGVRSCVVYPNMGGADAGLAVKVTHSTSAMQVQFHCTSIEQKRRLEPRAGGIAKSLGQQLRINVQASFGTTLDASDSADDFR